MANLSSHLENKLEPCVCVALNWVDIYLLLQAFGGMAVLLFLTQTEIKDLFISQALAAFDTSYRDREKVALFLDSVCQALVAEPAQFHRMLLHDLGGPMMLEAAQGGLPHNNAVQVEAIAEPYTIPQN